MTLKRMNNVLIVVEDFEAVKAFFVELGMELEGEATVEGPSVDRLVGLQNVRSEIAIMRTPNGQGLIELDKFHTPPAVRAEQKNTQSTPWAYLVSCSPSTISITSSRACVPMALNSFAKSLNTRSCTGSATFAILRSSSSRLPSSSAKVCLVAVETRIANYQLTGI